MKKTTSYLNKAALILVTGAFLLFNSCSKEEKNDPLSSSPTSKVSGTVTTPSGKKVPAATVKSGTYATKTDNKGKFELALPAGDHDLTIQTGEGRVFKTVVPVSVTAGANLELPLSETVLLQILDLAFIPGTFDQIEILIIDSLGYNATPIAVTDLLSLSNFSQYGALFLNCGLLGTNDMSSDKYTNLMDYATNHGSIYASDWAVECLTGDGNLRLAGSVNSHSHDHTAAARTTITCVSPLLGGFIADSVLCTQKMGNSGMYTGADILDPDMIIAAGTNTLDIHYDLSGWEIVHSYDAPFTPYISHSSLGILALKADLNSESSCGGIYFTTFHNKVQGVSNEVEAILNYIILNL